MKQAARSDLLPQLPTCWSMELCYLSRSFCGDATTWWRRWWSPWI